RARHFSEPFTGTRSWILAETRVALPEPGTYYAVVYDRARRGGRVWLALGDREDFGWRDILRLPGWIRAVRRFHREPGLPPWMWGAAFILCASIVGVAWWLRQGAN